MIPNSIGWAASAPMRSTICRQHFAGMTPRSPMPRVPRCVARWGGVCRSGRWWTSICCAYELVHRGRCLRPDLVDGAVRGPADRHASGRGSGPPERLAWRTGASAAAEEGGRHDPDRKRGLGRRLAADHQRLCELSPWLVRGAAGLVHTHNGPGGSTWPPTCRVNAFPPQTWPPPAASWASVLLTDHSQRVTPFCSKKRDSPRFYCASTIVRRTIIFRAIKGGGLAVRAAAGYGRRPATTWTDPAMRLSRSFIPTMKETPA